MPEEEVHRTATLIEHLEELRTRLLRCIYAVAILLPLSWPVSGIVIEWLRKTLCPPETKLYFMAPMEFFMLRMKVSVAIGIIVAIPFIAWQIWTFVAPALYKKERKATFSLVFSSVFFFLIGAAFALFGIFPMLIRYSMAMGGDYIQPLYNAGAFIGTAAMLMLAFGLCFQLPLVVIILVRSGVVELETMRKARAYIVVGIFTLAAFVTPPDMLSMLALALPTSLLFELSLLFAAWTAKHKKPEEETPDEEQADEQ